MKRNIQIHNFILGLLLLLFLTPVSSAVPGDVLYERNVEEGEDSQIETFPPSIFPHWKHRIQYRCDVCHDSLFEMKPGVTPVTMDMMKEGEVCGACHNGSIAFDDSFENCSRCHRAPAD